MSARHFVLLALKPSTRPSMVGALPHRTPARQMSISFSYGCQACSACFRAAPCGHKTVMSPNPNLIVPKPKTQNPNPRLTPAAKRVGLDHGPERVHLHPALGPFLLDWGVLGRSPGLRKGRLAVSVARDVHSAEARAGARTKGGPPEHVHHLLRESNEWRLQQLRRGGGDRSHGCNRDGAVRSQGLGVLDRRAA